MRILHHFLLLLAAASFCQLAVSCKQNGGEENHAMWIVRQIENPKSKYVLVASHRGDWRNFPENSVPAIESVIRMGVDIMELDLKLTKDSVLVLMHDKTVDRTTTGHGKVKDMTLDSLMTFDRRSMHGVRMPGTRVTTLREALEACKDRIVVNVDQGYEYYDLVLKLSDELGVTEQLLIKGKKPASIVRAKMAEHERNMMYMPIIDIQKPAGAALFAEYVENGEDPLAYEVCFSQLDSTVYDCCKRVVDSGSKLWVNTLWGSLCAGYDDDNAFVGAGPDEVYGTILSLGTSIIQTDRPEFLISYLKKHGRR